MYTLNFNVIYNNHNINLVDMSSNESFNDENVVASMVKAMKHILSDPIGGSIDSMYWGYWKDIVKGSNYERIEDFLFSSYDFLLNILCEACGFKKDSISYQYLQETIWRDGYSHNIITKILSWINQEVELPETEDEFIQQINRLAGSNDITTPTALSNSEPVATDKKSSAILSFIDNNADSILGKLKDSGLSLTAAALQNDENIASMAKVIFNILPAPVRLFVSFSTVEKFLLENRYWLIEKLK